MAELRDRAALEAAFAKRLSRLNSRHRRQLVALLGTPPDPANVPESFWKRVEKETTEEAAVLLALIFTASGLQHGLPHAEDKDAFRAQMEVDGRKYAEDRLKDLVPDYVQHSKDALDRAAADWETEDATGDVKPPSRKQIEEDVGKIFGPERAESMGVTETTGAQSAGGDGGIDATVGTSTQDIWVTERDRRVCPVCLPLDNTTRSNWERFFPSGPPAHPRCRCYVRHVNTKGTP